MDKPDIHTMKSIMNRLQPNNFNNILKILDDYGWNQVEYSEELLNTRIVEVPQERLRIYKDFGSSSEKIND